MTVQSASRLGGAPVSVNAIHAAKLDMRRSFENDIVGLMGLRCIGMDLGEWPHCADDCSSPRIPFLSGCWATPAKVTWRVLKTHSAFGDRAFYDRRPSTRADHHQICRPRIPIHITDWAN
ncbi:hypothetical protein B0H12DRAFT_636625 [Mycena haematopus]|nr:hypothetical protein B0H12DRAFT_636625 [Mycena haematopus]